MSIDLDALTNDYLCARRLLVERDPKAAAKLIGPVLEQLLLDLAIPLFKQRERKAAAVLRSYGRSIDDGPHRLSLGVLADLVTRGGGFDRLEADSSEGMDHLRSLNLDKCVQIRNDATHAGDPPRQVSLGNARFLLSCTEQLLAQRGGDVDAARAIDPESTPARFESPERAVEFLARRVWAYPTLNPANRSWAIKESAVLLGELERASTRPGLGVALFTTDLLESCLPRDGGDARLGAAVDWGVSRCSVVQPYLMEECERDPRTYELVCLPDFRHTIALGILMSRAGSHGDHRTHWSHLLEKLALPSGAWPAGLKEASTDQADLPATAYCLEFVDCCLRDGIGHRRALLALGLRATEWIASARTHGGGWSLGILPSADLDHAWTTSYLLIRLATGTRSFDTPQWGDVLRTGALAVLQRAASLDSGEGMFSFRIQTRIAAAIRVAHERGLFQGLERDSATSWLNRWEDRFVMEAGQVARRQLDLSTCAFALRALAHDELRQACARDAVAAVD